MKGWIKVTWMDEPLWLRPDSIVGIARFDSKITGNTFTRVLTTGGTVDVSEMPKEIEHALRGAD